MKWVAALLVFVVPLLAIEPEADPFAPSALPFPESLPPPAKGPGREVLVQVLEVRERGRIEPWPMEPTTEWLTDREGAPAVRSVKTKLNVAASLEQRSWVRINPAGKALAEPFWLGWQFSCRPDETEQPGTYSVNFLYTCEVLSGWVKEADGARLPLRQSRSTQTRVDINNRWLRVGSGDFRRTVNGRKEETEATALYLRIDDGLPPAAAAPVVLGPTFVTPAP